ncbi:hypothetical protein CHRY9390_01445 [Chryseobacterium aquaeductus]|uniref:Uncharacterized protein n=1 Tax=Chryseobacterium aquaeductus TaxID=2675056 RepID=A0A9N8MMW8_9FLAO|nr:hypothetical protein [Chryseobacterium aquaeductus]CAA7330772.1 hypothetical protein CHRY9390_01445 [Chryseobacterium potabilaquae]CAD7805974.1 hypothetical protein CHRY9390_01445 [Chryseobacterium aquaeductus]
MKDFDLDKLERKNIYNLPDNMFENIQAKVLSEVNGFDLEKVERKNIYKVSDHLFESIQENVMKKVNEDRKAPVFKLNWVYAAAASFALIFGSTFLYNSFSDSDNGSNLTPTYANTETPKNESEIAYETLKSDLTSVENSNQTIDNQQTNVQVKTVAYVPENTETKSKTVKPVSKKTEAQMTEYLDSFSNSEIAELANNSTQDVYLDLYN